jgi:beta-glucanase (GH16 family)
LKLRWKDEFDASAIDTKIWTYHLGDGRDFGAEGWFNKEKQCYTSDPENVGIDPATKSLAITARVGGTCVNPKDNITNDAAFTSAKLLSVEQVMWNGTAGQSKPVLVSARIKVPLKDKTFPAFWLLPMDATNPWCSGCGVHGGWCSSGEIDIMEHINKENITYSTIHFGGTADSDHGNCKNKQASFEFPADNGPDQWHIYSLLWDSTYIKTFVDGNIVLDAKLGDWTFGKDPSNKYAPFDGKMHIIINHAVGGNWPGLEPPDTSEFPYTIHVDYVAVHDVE